MTRYVTNKKKGFTLIEIMVVIIIIGILAAIAISILVSLKDKAYISTLKSDLSSAYKASVAYYTDYPEGEITLDILKAIGYSPSDRITLDIIGRRADNLHINATHPAVSAVYMVDKEGRISEQ
ncbi:MAG: prepilin-type N-terminal cleavage/methylation domain-containing protein [Thermodesulfobacteriota bacterium]|nr:prepilin-type N-terminal cleavage/methylation domain-containing protein [Thermodesulfobacteriota bacterium]